MLHTSHPLKLEAPIQDNSGSKDCVNLSSSIAVSRLKGKRVLVIGLGMSGQAAASFLLQRKAIVVGVDSKWDVLHENKHVAELCRRGMAVFHDSQELDIKQFDLVVVSPGVPSTHLYYRQALSMGIEVIGEVELACRELSQTCLAITGTNGKTTVTLLTEHVLNCAGKKALALGNIGTPLTAALEEQSSAEIFAIELSSFQLETLQERFVDVGVLLNITPDHLDRYDSIEEYALAKIRLKDCLKPKGRFFVEDKCFQKFRSLFGFEQVLTYGYSPENYVYTDSKHVYLDGNKAFSLPTIYQEMLSKALVKCHHDVENLMASYALCSQVGISGEQFAEALQMFQKPPHRIEFVRTVSGIHFYDDSKGTNIDAVIRAVDTFEGEVILIAGGVDKGAPYNPWIQAFAGKVKSICAIGQSADKIRNELEPHIDVMCFQTLEEAVAFTVKIAKKGDTVLLSPGCSSFDMFKDYTHRGREFQRIVNAL